MVSRMWVGGWVDGWVSGWVRQWVSGWVSGCVGGCLCSYLCVDGRAWGAVRACMTYSYVKPASFCSKQIVTCSPARCIRMCDMTHSYVWPDSFICAVWHIHTCDPTHSYMWHRVFSYAIARIHTCNRTHSYVWHHAFICATWRNHMCDRTHSIGDKSSPAARGATHSVNYDSYMRVAWLMHVRDMTHDSFYQKS